MKATAPLFAAALAALASQPLQARFQGMNAIALGYAAGGHTNAPPSTATNTVAVGPYAACSAFGPFVSAALVGVSAGAASSNVVRSVGVGAGAFLGAAGVTNCVAIGTDAGRGWTNDTGRIDVGGVFRANHQFANIARSVVLAGEGAATVFLGGLVFDGEVRNDGAGRIADADDMTGATLFFDMEYGRLVFATNGVELGFLALEPFPAERGR